MGTVMKASDFVAKLKDIATNYKTLYVMGCFGAPMTAANKKRYIDHHPYNKQPARVKLINAASADTFGFDCVCLIKGVLWGWNGDKSKIYGGAKYATNGVPDVDANTMINLCSEVSTDFKKIEAGEAVWTNGHIGVYIGNGLAIECTPAWKNRVQITACNCSKPGYNTRKWKKHGKLPYIDYTVASTAPTKTSKPKLDVATSYNKSIAGKYKVTHSAGLNIRTGASSSKKSLGVLPKGTVVSNFGYYNVASNGVKWLYVVTPDGLEGYCSMRYLTKS